MSTVTPPPELRSREIARRYLRKNWELLTAAERKVIESLLAGAGIARNTNREFDQTLTFGARLADRMASFGGSWTFILSFLAILAAWIVLNSFILQSRNRAFDPYPYILLNLFLSMIASLQAPIIMMSQNRQACRDRLDASHDYEVNLRAEIEIRSLHDKLDALRESQWAELVTMQQEQIRMLQGLSVKGG